MKNYEPIITKKMLIHILNSMNPSTESNQLDMFLNIWSKFVKQFANESIMFHDNKRDINAFSECFPLEYEFDGTRVQILFDITRILKYMNNGKINPILTTFSSIKTDFYYTRLNIVNFETKDAPPILTYMPSIKDNRLCHYATIDGNHRINKLLQNRSSFNIYIIPSISLKLECFLNLDSWIAFHLISEYHYIQELSQTECNSYLNTLKYMMAEASLILNKF